MAITQITPESISALSYGLSAVFDEARDKLIKDSAEGYKELVGQTVQSPNTDFLKVEVGSDIPELSEWDQTAGRTINRLGSVVKDIKTNWYQATIAVKENDIAFGRISVIKNKVSNLPMSESLYKKKLAMEILAGSDTSYDGVDLYSAAHLVKTVTGPPLTTGGTADGSVVGGIINVNVYSFSTNPLIIPANLASVEQRLMNMRDAHGNRFGQPADTILVSPNDYGSAVLAIDSQVLANGSSNVFYKRYKIIINPELESGSWVLMNSKLSPVIEVITHDLRFRSGTEIGDYDLFNKGDLKYGIDSQFAISCGMYEGVVMAKKGTTAEIKAETDALEATK